MDARDAASPSASRRRTTASGQLTSELDPADRDYSRLLAQFRSGQEMLREAESRFKLLVETIPGVAYIAEPGELGAWLYISPRLEALLGYQPEEWIAEPKLWIELIHPDDRAAVLEEEETWTASTAGVHVGEYRLRAKDGSYRWIRDAATARPGERPGDKAVWFGVLSDITKSREAEEALRNSEQLLRSVLETAQDAFVAVDGAGHVLEWNRSAEAMFGRRREDVLGQDLTNLVVPARLRATNPFALAQDETGPGPGVDGTTRELTALRADGSEFPTELALWATSSTQSQRYNVLIRDITERKQLEDELHARAFRDALTGLANRALFCDRLEFALASRGRAAGPVLILFLDIDDFKTVNDTLGHSAGDQMLTVVAERLRACVRPGDTVARVAGDEFAILLPDIASVALAEAVAQRIDLALREPLMLEGRKTVISASIGVASSMVSRMVTAEDLLREADAAMYDAKRSGKNRCVVYDPGMHATALIRMELQADLGLAIEREEFFLDYQPYFDLVDGRLAGFEALIRWGHPVRGLISPSEFIPLAEGTGVILPIGDWVLREACRQARAWQGDLPSDQSPSLSVNVSARQVQDPGLVTRVADALRVTGLQPQLLVLEVTEGVLLGRVEETVLVLQELRKLGVRIAVDDFGTGYSSLSYLQNLPIDILKIDKSFIDHLGTGGDETSMARVVVHIGQTLGLHLVAEGVESQAQLESLRALGCDSAQGFHLGRPMSSKDALGLVSALSPAVP